MAKEFELRGKLQSCQKLNRPLTEYLREFKLICDQLNAIGKPVDEITKVFGILEALGSDYETFKTTMYCLKPEPSYEDVIAQLERYEARHQNYLSNQINPNLARTGEKIDQSKLSSEADLGSFNSTFAFAGQRNFNRGFEGKNGKV